MRKVRVRLLAPTFTLLLAFAFTPPASPALVREVCNCTAPDGSCSASVSCRGGCTRYCGNNDNCYAYCSGATEILAMEVTFETRDGDYPAVVAELARLSGREIVFSPTKPKEAFNLGFKKVTMWDALELLSEHGTVRIAGQDFEKLRSLRRILLAGEKISFCVKSTPLNTVVSELGSLTGLPLRVTSGSPMATVNVQLPDATLKDILAKVSEQTGTKIMEVGADTGGR